MNDTLVVIAAHKNFNIPNLRNDVDVLILSSCKSDRDYKNTKYVHIDTEFEKEFGVYCGEVSKWIYLYNHKELYENYKKICLCHYSRYFEFLLNENNDGLTFDFIVPIKGSWTFYGCETNHKLYYKDHSELYFNIVKLYIFSQMPELKPYYRNFIRDDHFYCCNMFMGSVEFFNYYVEQHIKMLNFVNTTLNIRTHKDVERIIDDEWNYGDVLYDAYKPNQVKWNYRQYGFFGEMLSDILFNKYIRENGPNLKVSAASVIIFNHEHI